MLVAAIADEGPTPPPGGRAAREDERTTAGTSEPGEAALLSALRRARGGDPANNAG